MMGWVLLVLLAPLLVLFLCLWVDTLKHAYKRVIETFGPVKGNTPAERVRGIGYTESKQPENRGERV